LIIKEALCWGSGTALGELSSYFIARAHRLSGYETDEEDKLKKEAKDPEQMVRLTLSI